MAKQTFDYDLIVIGSGAGGSVAAHIAARAGKRVALVESGAFGGDSPNFGSVPMQALLQAARTYDAAKHGQQFGIRSAAIGYNYPSVKTWKDLAVKRTGAENSRRYHESAGIKVIAGAAHFLDSHQITVNRRHYSAAHFIIATGSSWSTPAIDGLELVNPLTPRSAIDLVRPPKSLLILGAGATGCEFAELFSTFGTRVTLADVSPRILPEEDLEVGEVIEDIFTHKRGMNLLTSCKVLSVSKEGVMKRVTYQRGGVEHSVKVDEIMTTGAKLPNTDIGLENAGVQYTAKGIRVNGLLQTTVPHIFAAGSVTGRYQLTHVATYESRVVAHNVLHRSKITADYRAVPRVTYVSPEVASVGINEEDAHRHVLDIKVAVAPIAIIGRANVSNSYDGFVKIITDKHGQLLGATVVSPNAGEVIHELTLAVQYGLSAQDIALTMHAFPSWSEAVRVVCSKI